MSVWEIDWQASCDEALRGHVDDGSLPQPRMKRQQKIVRCSQLDVGGGDVKAVLQLHSIPVHAVMSQQALPLTHQGSLLRTRFDIFLG